jgi:hypothetical protein
MDGNELDFWVSEPEPAIGYLRKVMVLPNGAGFLTYGLFIVEIINPDNILVQPAIARFSPNLDFIWAKHFGNKHWLSSGFEFFDIEQTLDGSYVAAGRSDIYLPDDPDLSTGAIVKFTEYGDSLWARYDTGPYPKNHINGHWLSGIGVLSSGNIVAGGTATLGWDENIWLVKVTTDGCMDTILCEPITGIVEQAKKGAAEMKVYPNPASGSVKVELPPGMAGIAELLVYNLQGKMVKREIAKNTDRCKLDISALAAGVYFLEIRHGSGSIWREKLIVQPHR